jgi:hypothetical protein
MIDETQQKESTRKRRLALAVVEKLNAKLTKRITINRYFAG